MMVKLMRVLRVIPTLMLVLPNAVAADDFRPLYVELREIDEGRYTVRIKRPPRVPATNHPWVEFPEFCSKQPGRQSTYICSQDLAGATLTIRYPRFGVASSTVIKLSFYSGENHTITLSSGKVAWRMPKREEIATVAAQFALLVIAALRFMNQWPWFASTGQNLIGYFAGCVAAYWFIERTAGYVM